MKILKQKIIAVLKAVTDYAARNTRNTCLHEETYRGGFLWEICSQCGARWADDEGGKPLAVYEMSKPIDDAYNLIAEIENGTSK